MEIFINILHAMSIFIISLGIIYHIIFYPEIKKVKRSLFPKKFTEDNNEHTTENK